VLDPLERAFHRRRRESRAPNASIAFDGGEPGALEHAHVLRDGGQRHVEARRELADRALAGREPSQDFSARGIGEGAKRRVEQLSVMVNHMV